MPLNYNHAEDPTNRLRGVPDRGWKNQPGMSGGGAGGRPTRITPPMSPDMAARARDADAETMSQWAAVMGANALGSQGGTPRTRYTPRLGTPPDVDPGVPFRYNERGL